MKIKISLIALLVTLASFSQKKVEKLKEYTAPNGVNYKIGDEITLNRGSNDNGSFNYVMIGGWAASTAKLPATNSGLVVTIKKIKKYNKKRYKGVVFTVGGGNITNYLIMIKEAIDSCEITPCKSENEKVVKTESKYDKIKKIKELLDDGVLTKEEFEAEKKKILNSKDK
ncbi:hypothetical protein BTO06_10000 [Tenacibaculum sp. SZ-18]|uniref:SHOCT domain-containing protein n=1 Tax=Tenacibaculum sp. SZ-18 TaxID=754423 RepID=UPI000C2D485C|nr:SHOCT domain-containing protein [Tenacibaculum sp. SZ-18]AUC15453.1 hypothetical protein BTO06_10000 [Tenacibaculum sp. SZ-18]